MAGCTGLGAGVKEAMNAVWATGAVTVGFQALRTREPVILAEGRKALLENPAYAPARHVMRRQTWEAAAWLPLYYHDHPVGLVTAHYRSADEITPEELSFLQAISDQAAIAVETARLFGEASGKAALVERQRLARELHDSVSQALYGIALGARTARTQIERAPEKAIEPLDYVLSLAEAGLAEMRSLIFELRPESLEAEGLCVALGKQIEAIRARHQIEVTAEIGSEPQIPLETKETLYRIAQESLHNVVKHARATQVSLVLEVADGSVSLAVTDNGHGFDPGGDFPGHLGLKSMRERAARAGGTLTVQSSTGGTSLTATLPLAAHV
jgi:signal transduction histidine kinase